MARTCTSEPDAGMSLRGAGYGKARLDGTRTGLLTDKVSLFLKIQLNLLLGVLERNESGGPFFWDGVKFRADASGRAACRRNRTIGEVVGGLGYPEHVHFL